MSEHFSENSTMNESRQHDGGPCVVDVWSIANLFERRLESRN